MAELTPLDEKLGEVLGLAQAATQVTDKVAKLAEDDDTRELLERMSAEAKETAERAAQVADGRDGRKTAIHDKARETKQELSEMAKTYLEGSDTDELDGFEFLVMAEAGELGHWEIVQKMSQTVNEGPVIELAEWAVEVQRRHFENVREASLQLAEQEVRS